MKDLFDALLRPFRAYRDFLARDEARKAACRRKGICWFCEQNPADDRDGECGECVMYRIP